MGNTEPRISPPDPKEPCHCDLQAVIDEVSNALDDAMYSHGLEWDCSVAKAEAVLREFINTVVAGPTRSCGECKGER